MKTIVHIHTDKKFLDFHQNYLLPDKYNNIIVYFGYEDPEQFSGIKNFHHFHHNLKDLSKAIALCENADILILHKLDFVKAYIVNRVKKDILIIWRFFGQELYSRMSDRVYSEKTKRNLKFNSPGFALKKLKKAVVNNFKIFLKYRAFAGKERKGVYEKIDYFLGLSGEEYRLLKSRFPEIPAFLQHPYYKEDFIDFSSINSEAKIPNVIIGNNRSKYNNHLDILDLISETKASPGIGFTLLFNYGSKNTYTQEVIRRSEDIAGLKVIHDFLPLEELMKLYMFTSAIVINGYRQMAMGNILFALRSKTKLYLHPRNPVYHDLVQEGFHIYNVEQLSRDLEEGNIKLPEALGVGNYLNYDRICEKYSIRSFDEFLSRTIK